MKKEEFLGKLKDLLGDIPTIERDEALAYYRSYFEDAGEENEDQIILELESPEKVAWIIKSDCVTDVVEATTTKNMNKEPESFYQRNKGLSIFLIIMLIIFASPLLLGAAGTLFGFFMTIIGLIIASFGATIGLLISGLVCIGLGIGTISVNIGAGLILLGIGSILLVFGILFLIAALWLSIKFIPWVIRSVVKLFQGNKKNDKGGALA